jgi:hypothetical protein
MAKAMGSYKIGNTMHCENRDILFGAFQNNQAFFLPLVKSSKNIHRRATESAELLFFFAFR